MSNKRRRTKGSGSVYTRKDGRVVGQYEINGQTRYIYGRDEKQVADRVAEAIKNRDARIDSENMTVGDYLDKWLTAIKDTVRIGTWKQYEMIVRIHIKPTLGTAKLDKLNALQIMGSSPSFFERLVVDLLVRMGYGGTRKEAGKAVGGSGDEGIDGIINEDRLGLEVVYIQAKRWQSTVGRPEIQKFVGALHGKNARKGIFITTSDFTNGATQYAEGLADKVVLIDGETLANLMIDHSVGVALEEAYEIKRVDSDYFSEA